MGKKTKDFDQFFKERKAEGPTFKLFGEVYSLPPVLPASVPLRLIRLEAEYGDMDTVPESEIMALSVSLFGAALLDTLCEKGLDVEQLGHLIKWAMMVYTGRDSDEPDGEPGQEGEQNPQ